MGVTAGQIKAELRQLPLMLGKLLGGNRGGNRVHGRGRDHDPEARTRDPEYLLPLLLGCAGIPIFMLSARGRRRRSSIPGEEAPIPANSTVMNALPWVLLLTYQRPPQRFQT